MVALSDVGFTPRERPKGQLWSQNQRMATDMYWEVPVTSLIRTLQMRPRSLRTCLLKLRLAALKLLVGQQEVGVFMVQLVLSLIVGSGLALKMYLQRRRKRMSLQSSV